MTLANPYALWFLALIPPVVLLYLLKMKRRPVTVSSTLLWEEVLSDIQANTPFQRLRANLQLILQLLILLLLTLAIADLLIDGDGPTGRRVVAIVDASASMSSRDGKGAATRLGQARQQLRTMISDMGPGDRMMVLVAAADAVIAQLPLTDSQAQLGRFVDAIAPTDAGPGVREALLVAFAALQQRGERGEPEVVLLSDGGTGDLTDLGAPPVSVRYLKCGERGENLGITALSVRRIMGSRRHAVFVEVTNASPRPRTVFLSLGEGTEGGEIASAKLPIPAGRRATRTFELDIAPGPINLSLDGEDDLPSDDRVIAFIPPPERAVVGVVGLGGSFVERALRTDELVELRNYVPGGLYDIVLAAGAIPDPLPDCPVVLFEPKGRLPAGIQRTGELRAARLSRWNRSHPLLRYLELGDVAIYKATALGGPGALPLVWARPTSGGEGSGIPSEAPVVVGLAGRRHPTLLIGFPLKWSNWPLRASFPLFVFNLIEHARELRRKSSGRAARPGETIPIEVDEDATLTVTRPDEQTLELPPPGRIRYFHRTDRVGIYRWTAAARRGAFAVNLLDRQETRTAPTVTVDLENEKAVDQTDVDDEPKRPIWRWIALLAILFVLIEWWVFHRKIG